MILPLLGTFGKKKFETFIRHVHLTYSELNNFLHNVLDCPCIVLPPQSETRYTPSKVHQTNSVATEQLCTVFQVLQ